MRKNTHFLFLAIIIVVFAILITKSLFQKNYPKEKIDVTDMAKASVEMIPVRKIFLEDLGLQNFTATGLAYDKKTDSFWIGDHGTYIGDSIRLVQVSSDFGDLKEIINIDGYLNSEKNNLQGIAYDAFNDNFICAMGEEIIVVSKSGGVIKSYTDDEIKKYKANGVCIDEQDQSIWILCFDNVLIHYDKMYNLIESYSVNFKDQDMLFCEDNSIYITIGADYEGNNNFVALFDKKTHELQVKFCATESYAVEGICIYNHQIYVINDGCFHNAKIPKTYVCVYEIQE